jgi:hypothetical protein
MATEEEWSPDLDHVREVDEALADWQQGDVLKNENASFVVLTDGQRPLTPAAANALSVAGDSDTPIIAEEVAEAFVITSQTCDIVESSKAIPRITLSPLIRLSTDDASIAGAGWIPRFAPVPGYAPNAFADLGHSMSIEKAVVVSWERTRGLRTDEEMRRFQRTAERNIGRFAFPDDLKPAVDSLRERIRDKRGKESFEGKALDAVEEIRMVAIPNWNASDIEVDIYFLSESQEAWEAAEAWVTAQDPKSLKGQVTTWDGLRVAWEKRCKPYGVIRNVRVVVDVMEEFNGRTYIDSDPMDLGGMSPL